METMATADGRADPSVADLLFDPRRAGGWEFWQAVRLLESMHARLPEPRPARAVRFSSYVGLAFPASDVERIDPAGEKSPVPSMSVHFLGIAGVTGPLPRPFTELVLERASRHNAELRDFLDLFNDRLVWLAYGVRRKHRLALTLAPPEGSEVAGTLRALAGLGTGGVRGRVVRHRPEDGTAEDGGVLAYAGLLARQPRSMVGLEELLSRYFGVPVRGRQFVGRWLPIEPDQHTRIGPTGVNQRLGTESTLGTRFWDQGASFELRVGPLTRRQFREFLPGRAGHSRIRAITRFYVGAEPEFTVRLVLHGREVPGSRLGGVHPPQLGWTSFLRTGRFNAPEVEVAPGTRVHAES